MKPLRASLVAGCLHQVLGSARKLKHGFPEDMEVTYIGSLKVDIDVREQDSVSQILLDRFNCVPTFIPPDLLQRFYKFCNNQLWPLFHYMLPFSVDHGGRFNRSVGRLCVGQ
ncbi:hypothetical protein Droror1_Dr00011160 [Drosera rotundifolia]